MIDGWSAVTWLSIIVFGLFIFDWAAIYFEWVGIKPITKILAMGSVIAWTLVALGWATGEIAILLLAAQGFGMVGDIFLLFRKKWFLLGLAAFLMGHLFYFAIIIYELFSLVALVGFSPNLITWLLPMLLVWSAIMVGFYRIFTPIANEKRLWIAIQIYAWIISATAFAAFLLFLFLPEPKWLIFFLPFGAFLFLVSDSLLAYNRFISQIKRGQFWVRITYHLSQFSLAYGFISLIK